MKRGFTLIELLSVIVILAIIALIAIPQITNVVSNVRLKADLESVRGYISSAENYYMKAEFNQDIYDTLGTNVIDNLDIKKSKLEGSIIITRDGKIEVAVIKNNRCYKKGALDDNTSIKVLDKSLCLVNANSYFSNNGRLRVEGTKILNQYNEEIRLQGAAIELDLSLEQNKKIYSKKSLSTLKSWGANIVRIFVHSNNYGNNPDDYIKYVYNAIDNAIKNDMYVLINWKPGDSSTNPYLDLAKDMFRKVTSKYKNDPHFLYEIWNEANNPQTTWNNIKNYAEQIIPYIREISPDSIIICSQPLYGTKFIENKDNLLNFKNIMYSYHSYAENVSEAYLNKVIDGLNAGIPIFVTEWAATETGTSSNDILYEAHSVAFAKILEKYNLSHIMFCFQPAQWSYGFTKQGEWNENLPDSILKPNALFFKKVLRKDYTTSINLMANNGSFSDGKYYRSNEWKDKIVSIAFKNKLSVPSNAVVSWDLSLAKDKTIIGYLESTKESDRYKLIICADGYINAPASMSYLFANMKNLKSIDFTNFKTKLSRHMVGIFKDDVNLVELNLSGFDVKSVTNMQEMFNGCKSLKKVNFNGWHTGDVELVGYLFNGCSSLEEIDLSGVNVSKVKSYEWMFFGCSSLKKVNISNWNPKTLTSASSMFNGCKSLESVDMSYTVFNSTTNLSNMFNNVNSNAVIYVKNNEMINFLKDINSNVSIQLKYNNISGLTGNLTWDFNQSTGKLVIDGNGKMPDYDEGKAPWYQYRNYITDITVGENVTKIGNYAFYDLCAVKYLRINSKNLDDFSKKDVNIGNNFVLYHIGKDVGTTIIFGEKVEKIPTMFMQPTDFGHDKTNVINIIFKGNRISKIGNYGLAYIKSNSIVLNEGIKSTSGLSLGYSYYKFIVLPDSLVNISDWLFGSDSRLEKVVFGPNINSLSQFVFASDSSLKEIVIPHINNTNAHANLFKSTKTPIIIYGDSSAEELVNNYKSASGLNNVLYKNINEYKSSITSNSNITGSIGYNESFTFTSSGNVKVYYKFVDSTGKEYLSNPLNITKNGNTYTIDKVKSDIYIEVK